MTFLRLSSLHVFSRSRYSRYWRGTLRKKVIKALIALALSVFSIRNLIRSLSIPSKSRSQLWRVTARSRSRHQRERNIEELGS